MNDGRAFLSSCAVEKVKLSRDCVGFIVLIEIIFGCSLYLQKTVLSLLLSFFFICETPYFDLVFSSNAAGTVITKVLHLDTETSHLRNI